MRRQLIDQIGGAVGKLVFQFQPNSRGQEGGFLEDSTYHRVEVVLEQSTQPLCDARTIPAQIPSPVLLKLGRSSGRAHGAGA